MNASSFQWVFYKHGAVHKKILLQFPIFTQLPWQQHHDDAKQNWIFVIFVLWVVCRKDNITCVLTWAWVCSNSSSFMLFDTGTWNTDMPATLLHSDRTLAMATMASSRVSRQLKAKLSNFSSKGYDGTSGWKPDHERKEIVSCSSSRFLKPRSQGFSLPTFSSVKNSPGNEVGFLTNSRLQTDEHTRTRVTQRTRDHRAKYLCPPRLAQRVHFAHSVIFWRKIWDYSQAMTSSKIYMQTSVRDHFFLLLW